ncbi:MAG TPA: sugar transferase [Rhodopila sp.]|nr:sugar transferase [Rhodopila sp.]
MAVLRPVKAALCFDSQFRAQRHDPGLTRVGRCIRTTRINELPQPVNVRGEEMSRVGPRPDRQPIVERLPRRSRVSGSGERPLANRRS